MAELRGYDLHFHRRSTDRSGQCDVVESNDESRKVYGVLYEIAVEENPALDRAKGLGSGYEEKAAKVVFRWAPRSASIYYAIDFDTSLKPYTRYKKLVIAGAKEHAIRVSYSDGLVATGAVVDPDQGRENRNWPLLITNRAGQQA
jgi:gamma-glutamylcyclotransferase